MTLVCGGGGEERGRGVIPGSRHSREDGSAVVGAGAGSRP